MQPMGAALQAYHSALRLETGVRSWKSCCEAPERRQIFVAYIRPEHSRFEMETDGPRLVTLSPLRVRLMQDRLV